MQTKSTLPIGVFDSGLGGISVLRELCALMPEEDFVFFGDRANAPYGNRSTSEVLDLSRAALKKLQGEGCKAMVIACNTATGIAAETLRKENPDFPIVAIEPALKPAVERFPKKVIFLMATPLAIKTPRILALAKRFENDADVRLIPCPGLVELIEAGHLNDAFLTDYLKTLFPSEKPAAVVLGCTHYPLVSEALQNFFGTDVALLDGGLGTAKRMQDILKEKNLESPKKKKGTVRFLFSQEDEKTASLAKSLL